MSVVCTNFFIHSQQHTICSLIAILRFSLQVGFVTCNALVMKLTLCHAYQIMSGQTDMKLFRTVTNNVKCHLVQRNAIYTLDQNDGIFFEFVVLCRSLMSLTSYSTKRMKEPIFCKKLSTYSLRHKNIQYRTIMMDQFMFQV